MNNQLPYTCITIQRPSQDVVMMTPVRSTSATGRCYEQTTDVYLYNTLTSVKGRGHDGHGQFNIRLGTWSWTDHRGIPV